MLCLWRPFLDLLSVSRCFSARLHSRPLVGASFLCGGERFRLWSESPCCVLFSTSGRSFSALPEVRCDGGSPKKCTAVHLQFMSVEIWSFRQCARQLMSAEIWRHPSVVYHNSCQLNLALLLTWTPFLSEHDSSWL